MFPLVVILGLLYLQVCLILYVILKPTSRELEKHRKNIASFLSKMNILNRCGLASPYLIFPKSKPLPSHMVGWKYPAQPDTSTMIGWTIEAGWTRNSIAKKFSIRTVTKYTCPWSIRPTKLRDFTTIVPVLWITCHQNPVHSIIQFRCGEVVHSLRFSHHT